jgi:hypothetical protein
MTDLDALLRSAAPAQELPAHFSQEVFERIARHERRTMIIKALFLAGSLMVFFYALSLLAVDMLAAQTFDFLSRAFTTPRMLAMLEGWLALLEAIPIFSLSLLTLTTVATVSILRMLLRSLHHLPSFPLRYAH